MIKIEVGKKYTIIPTRSKALDDKTCECIKSDRPEYIFKYDDILFKIERIKNKFVITSVNEIEQNPITVNILNECDIDKSVQLEMPMHPEPLPDYGTIVDIIENDFKDCVVIGTTSARKVRVKIITNLYNSRKGTNYFPIEIKRILIQNGFETFSYGGYTKIPKALYDKMMEKNGIKVKKRGRPKLDNIPIKTPKGLSEQNLVEHIENIIHSLNGIIRYIENR